MKRLFLVLLAAFSMSAFADTYMYWMVGDDITLDGNAFANYTSAKVGIKTDQGGKSGDYLNLYAWDQSLGTTYTATPGDNTALYANITGMEGKTFYIELFNGDTSVGFSSEMSYNNALAYSTGFGMDKPVSIPWITVGFSSVVPEPNSAMLMLLGCAMLAIRRRKMKKA